MATDTLILAAGTAPTPLDYTVPGAQAVIPLSVSAEFDGSGAAGDFVPTLLIESDGGVVIAEIPVSTVVTAGASVRASWFPGGGLGGTAAAPTSLEWCYADATLDLTGAPPAYFDFVTTAPSIFSVDIPNGRVLLSATGTYLALGHLEIQSNVLPAVQGITLGTTLTPAASNSDSAAVFGPWDLGNPGGAAGTFRSWLPAQALLITVNAITNLGNPPQINASASGNPAAAASGDFTMTVIRLGSPLGTAL